MSDIICDFCGSDTVLWVYEVVGEESPIVRMGGMMFKDLNREWYACDVCSSMIECEDSMGLENRSLTAWMLAQKHVTRLPGNEVDVYFKHVIEGVHRLFWMRQTGDRRLIQGG